ncbi:DVU0298 family protein [Pseudodesulfovibrio tunisiensis]|uniref:DVU0298 family protein n=1 Tax=Pseudodesulfovibrio tunisiensis TaxID=463192 RepID=UPI001FB288D0|nr:DVU0298 family protein [Pseudodesulfovibrio tunisiensis]
MSRFRQIKKDVRNILAAEDWQDRLTELDAWAPGLLAPPLFSLRLDRDENVRWRAVVAFGMTAARMAEAGMEKARVLMRTCMWYMNEESGNLGWGIPEFMAEAMARHERLAREFHTILASYIYCDEKCDGNFLDHPELRRGVLWGLGRLAQVRPELVSQGERFLIAALDEDDPYNRGYAAWTLGILGATEARPALKALYGDAREIRLFDQGQIMDVTVETLARQAAESLGLK